ncbi:MAG TPA: hypothetical protein VIE63_17715 [Ramlibacter sp.]
MNKAMTISLELQDSLLTARVRGHVDDLAEGTRVLDAVGAESMRVGADRALVDFSELRGSLMQDYQAELAQYASARLGRLRCALLLPPLFDGERRGVSTASGLASFETEPAALDWLQQRMGAQAHSAPTRAPARTLVHLI